MMLTSSDSSCGDLHANKQEREHFEYIIGEGTLVHRRTGYLLDTNQGMQDSKWIFVMSTSKKLYAGDLIWTSTITLCNALLFLFAND